MLLRGYQLSVSVPKIIFSLLSILKTSSNFTQIRVYPRLSSCDKKGVPRHVLIRMVRPIRFSFFGTGHTPRNMTPCSLYIHFRILVDPGPDSGDEEKVETGGKKVDKGKVGWYFLRRIFPTGFDFLLSPTIWPWVSEDAEVYVKRT